MGRRWLTTTFFLFDGHFSKTHVDFTINNYFWLNGEFQETNGVFFGGFLMTYGDDFFLGGQGRVMGRRLLFLD